jgi:thymidylate kinase
VPEPTAELIRDLLRTGRLEPTKMRDAQILALLCTADRLHYKGTLETWLQRGYDIVADRCALSTAVYQHPAVDASDTATRFMELMVSKALRPDMIIVLDVDVEVALRRIDRRPGTRDVTERDAFLRSLARKYAAVPDGVRLPYDWRTEVAWTHVNANMPLESVVDECLQAIEQVRELKELR